jgi:MFS family permease
VSGPNSHKWPPFVERIVRYNTLQLLTYAALASSSLIMPLYAASLGAGTAQIGLIGAAYGVASFVSNTLFGRAGDRIDRRKLLLFGFLAAAVGSALQFFAASPTTLLWARFALGVSIGMIPPTLAAYVYDVNRPLGKFTSYNAFGWLLASFVVIALSYASTHAFRLPMLESLRDATVVRFGASRIVFALGALFCLAAFWLAWGLRPMRLGLNVPRFPLDVMRRNVHVYLSVFVRHVGAASIWVIYPLYIVSLGGDLALVVWVHVVNMISQILLYRNVERLRRLGSAAWLLGIGLGLSALTFLSFSFVHTAIQLLPLQVPLGISFACLWLGSMKEVLERNVERATATGLLNASMNLSNVAGPLIGGFVAASLGFRATMYFAFVLTGLALLLFLILRPAPAKTVAPVAQSAGAMGDVQEG